MLRCSSLAAHPQTGRAHSGALENDVVRQGGLRTSGQSIRIEFGSSWRGIMYLAPSFSYATRPAWRNASRMWATLLPSDAASDSNIFLSSERTLKVSRGPLERGGFYH